MRTNSELKKIFAELNKIKAELDNILTNTALSETEAVAKFSELAPVLTSVMDRYDRIDRVWAKDALVNDIDYLIAEIFGRYSASPDLTITGAYQMAKNSLSHRIDSLYNPEKSGEFRVEAGDMDDSVDQIKLRHDALVSYINNDNNGRQTAKLYRILTKAGLGACILGLGGVTFLAVNQGANLKNLSAQHESLKTQYGIVEKESQEHYEARQEWEQNAKEWEQKAGEWYNKYNELLQNPGEDSGISKEQYDKIKKECEKWESKYNDLKGKYDTVLANYNAIIEVVPSGSNAVEYIKGLATTVQELKTEIEGLEVRIAALDAAKSTLEKKVNELAAQLEAALKDNSNQAVIETLKKQLEETNARYQELQATYNQAVQTHNAKVAQYESTINGLETALQTEKDKNKNLQNENAQLNAVAQKIASAYSKLYPNGKVTGAGNQFDAILSFYAQQPNGINLARDFLVKFVAEVKGVPQSQIAKLSDAELVAMADSLVGLPSAPSENPNGNVHEQGSSNKGNSGSNQETEKGDGSGNVTPDLPPARE